MSAQQREAALEALARWRAGVASRLDQALGWRDQFEVAGRPVPELESMLSPFELSALRAGWR
jgi:hypothetical protein